MKLCKVIRRQFYIENMRKNFQYSLILISCTLIGLQIYLTLFFSKNKVIYQLYDVIIHLTGFFLLDGVYTQFLCR